MASSSTSCTTKYENEIAKHLLPDKVPMKTFALLNITKNNADDEYSFSKAYLQYSKTGPGVPLWLMWHKSLSSIMKIIAGEGDSIEDKRVEEAVEGLVTFLSNETHRKCMSELFKTLTDKVTEAQDKVTEAHIQAVFSHHFFVPLVPNTTYIIDHKKLDEKCPGCYRSVNLGDTSLGNSSVWHGEADILIHKSAIMFGRDEKEEDDTENEIEENVTEEEYFEDHDITEPLAKRLKTTTEHQHIDNKNNDSIVQALAQTIVNAFCEINSNEQLQDMFIPSFLVTTNTISIYMYNCKQDRLFMLPDLPIWRIGESEECLNLETVICTWLLLNFEIFQNIVPGEEFDLRKLPSSNFQTTVGNKLLIYKELMSKPMKKNHRTPRVEDNVNYCIDLHLIKSDFVGKALETLQEVKNIYEKIENTSFKQ